MRLRICSKIPPAILVGLFITLVVINKKSTTEKEVDSMGLKETQSNANLFEQSHGINDGEGEEETDNTLQNSKEDFKQHMKNLQEKMDAATKESDAGKDIPETSQIIKDIPETSQTIKDAPETSKIMSQNKKEIGRDMAATKENIVENKQTIKVKTPEQDNPTIIQDTKVEPKPITVKTYQAPAESSVSENNVDPMFKFKKEVEKDAELQGSQKKFSGIVTLAQNVLRSATNPKILLLSFVHEDNAVFANNWLCNTKVLDLHSSLIIVTYGSESKELLSEKWPLLNMYPIEPDTPEENLRGTPHTLTKLQIIYVLLNAGINMLLLDVQSVWFSNPMPSFKSGGADMMVNIASSVQVNTGFIVLFATEKNKYFWGSLYLKVKAFEKRTDVSIESQYDKLLKIMTVRRFGDISFNELPNESYIEGMWYELTSEERQKTRPIVVRNNKLLGFAKRIRRAMAWKHWFVVEEGMCDVDRVSKIVNTPPKV